MLDGGAIGILADAFSEVKEYGDGEIHISTGHPKEDMQYSKAELPCGGAFHSFLLSHPWN